MTEAADAYAVRPPRPGDAEQLGALHCRVWRETYRDVMSPEAYAALSPESFAAGWTRSLGAMDREGRGTRGQTVRVAEHDGELVAFVTVGTAREEDAPVGRQLWALNVLPEHHGTGLADRLMAEVLGDGPAYLWVARGNARAVRFYERHGFALDGVSRLDDEGITELRMVRP